LVIATHGRSFWVLDDVTPLRQLSAQTAASEVWLFRPQTAYRTRPGSDQATPVPLDEPMAANPPDGAVLDYYLRERPATPVQLEIFDGEGRLVRRFASNEELPKTDPKEVVISMDWVRDEAPLPVEAGMHRFVWDLHYPLPKSVHRSFEGPFGPWAVPGDYTVKLTVNGKSSSQPLAVKMDPRVATPQSALVREFQAASRAAAGLGEISAANQQAQELRKQLELRSKDVAGNADLAKALADLDQKIGDLAGAHKEEGFGLFGLALPSGEPATLDQVSTAWSALLLIVESADAAPTVDVAVAMESWEVANKSVLARWEALREDEARVNSLLLKLGLQPLKAGESQRKEKK
jgi:hypothetical protein